MDLKLAEIMAEALSGYTTRVMVPSGSRAMRGFNLVSTQNLSNLIVTRIPSDWTGQNCRLVWLDMGEAVTENKIGCIRLAHGGS